MKYKNSSKILKDFRLKNELSQDQFGKAIGLHHQAVSNAERGMASIAPKRIKRMIKRFRGFPTQEFIQAFTLDKALDAAEKLQKTLR